MTLEEVTHRVTVVSTGFNAPTKRLCLASVAAQKGVTVDHIYVEASEQSPPKTGIENFVDAVRELPPDRVVAWIDGDDWLAHDRALHTIALVHATGVWATWGSYMHIDGTKGIAAPVLDEAYRKHPWVFSHLKTMRAGLVHRIQPDDLKVDGAFSPRCADVAIMLPVLEQAGRRRVQFVEDTLYVYNFDNSFESSASREAIAREERGTEAKFRAKRRYARLEAL